MSDQAISTDASASIPSTQPTTTVFHIPNMDCRSEEAEIRARLAELQGIESLSFDLPERRLTVVHALPTPQALLQALVGIGMQASIEAEPAGGATCGSSCSSGCGSQRATIKEVFTIPNMDCRNEEAAIRSRLEALPGIQSLTFDLPARQLTVAHALASAAPILEQLEAIGMRVRLGADPAAAAPSISTLDTDCGPCGKPAPSLGLSPAPATSGSTTQFLITNMDCPTEEALIRKRLGKVDGIHGLDFDLMNRRLKVQHGLPSPAPVLAALSEIGMKATVEHEAGASPQGQATYLIEKMDCPTEEALLRKALENLPGVSALQFDLMSRRLTVSHSLPDEEPITAAIERLGMSPVLQDNSRRATGAGEIRAGITKTQWLRMAAAGVLAIGAEGMAFSGLGESSLPVVGASLAAIALGGVETLKKGWIALRALSLNMNLLMTMAVIGAALIGQWPEAAVVIWLFGIAEMIEALTHLLEQKVDIRVIQVLLGHKRLETTSLYAAVATDLLRRVISPLDQTSETPAAAPSPEASVT